jgi:hypothetical protein
MQFFSSHGWTAGGEVAGYWVRDDGRHMMDIRVRPGLIISGPVDTITVAVA